MNNYKLTIAYDGSDYYGYQRQSRYITVQETLEKSLRKLLRQDVKINGSGRTDTGVHALGQVVNFKSDIDIPVDKMQLALNNILPGNIRISQVELAPEGFHARYSAVSKHYKYKIIQTSMPSPFMQKYAWQITRALDIEQMRLATALVIGKHDFNSFRSTGSIEGSPVRIVYAATWSLETVCDRSIPGAVAAKNYEFDIHGNGFLYHMVRNLVGLIIQVGLGRMSVREFEHLFIARQRTSKSVIAPPEGLYLNKVEY